MLSNIINFFESDVFWIGVILIGTLVCMILKATQPKPKPKPTTIDALGDIKNQIGFLTDEVRGIKNKMK